MKYISLIIGFTATITGAYALGENQYSPENFHFLLAYTTLAIAYTIAAVYLIKYEKKNK